MASRNITLPRQESYRRPKAGVVTIYFVGPDNGPIKIGHAYQVDKRLRTLELLNAFPLRLWAATLGPPSLEGAYHLRFETHRLHGEWFARCPEIEAEIVRLNRPCNRARVQGLSSEMLAACQR
jgi:hypothetical protein